MRSLFDVHLNDSGRLNRPSEALLYISRAACGNGRHAHVHVRACSFLLCSSSSRRHASAVLCVRREEEAILLDGLNVAQMRELREKAQKRHFEAEVNRMMKIIINSLYKNKEARLTLDVWRFRVLSSALSFFWAAPRRTVGILYCIWKPYCTASKYNVKQ